MRSSALNDTLTDLFLKIQLLPILSLIAYHTLGWLRSCAVSTHRVAKATRIRWLVEIGIVRTLLDTCEILPVQNARNLKVPAIYTRA